jgi:Replication-relaxation
MRTAELNILRLLNRRSLGRTNFIALGAGGSAEHNRKMLYELARKGQIRWHKPEGGQSQARAYPSTFFNIYENNNASKKLLRQSGIEPISHRNVEEDDGQDTTWGPDFWHQLLIDDVLISIEIACRQNGLPYEDLFGLLDLPCHVSHTINGKPHTSKAAWRPDAVFRISEKYYALEADRGTEPVERNNLQQSSFLRKFLQIKHVFQSQLYKTDWNLDNLMVLVVTIDVGRTIRSYLENKLKWKSSFILFHSAPSLASTIKSPVPALNLITEPWQRVGYPPFSFLDPQ